MRKTKKTVSEWYTYIWAKEVSLNPDASHSFSTTRPEVSMSPNISEEAKARSKPNSCTSVAVPKQITDCAWCAKYELRHNTRQNSTRTVRS